MIQTLNPASSGAWPMARLRFAQALLGASLILALSACKPPQSEKNKLKAAPVKSGLFQARVLPRDERDPHLPSKSDDHSQQNVQQDDKVVFSEVIVLKSSEKPAHLSTVASAVFPASEAFLVWDENTLGEPITQAYFTYERQDSGNRKPESGLRQNVSQDKDTQRWFIPLVEAIGIPPEEIDPSETHWFILELHQSSGKTHTIRVGLRIRGPLPKLSLQNESMSVSDATSSGSKRVFARVEVTNPSKRTLDLWIEGEEGQFEYQSAVRHSLLPGPSIFPDVPGPTHAFYRTSGQFTLSYIRIERAGKAEMSPFKAGERFKVRLHAGEKIRLFWIVTPTEGTYVCSLPAPRSFTATGSFRARIHYTYEVVEKWEVIGIRLQPTSMMKLSLADGWETQELLDFTPKNKSSGDWERIAGTFNPSWPVHPGCHGVF